MRIKKVFSTVYLFLLILGSLWLPIYLWRYEQGLTMFTVIIDIFMISLFIVNQDNHNRDLHPLLVECCRALLMISSMTLASTAVVISGILFATHYYVASLTVLTGLVMIGAVVLAGKCIKEILK